MSNGARRGGGSALGGVLLIVLGALFLYANLDPSFNPWPLFARFWPLLLVLWGLARLWRYWRGSQHPEAARAGALTARDIFLIVCIVLIGLVISRGVSHRGSVTDFRGTAHTDTQTVELQGAGSVRVELVMGAGELIVGGGADKLLQGDFSYSVPEWKPRIAYDVVDNRGRLKVEQEAGTVHMGHANNRWDLRLNNDVPMELHVRMGAGESRLNLGGLSLSRLTVEGGAGDLDVDLTGDWAQDLEAHIKGGVGRVTLHLPTEVGVEVSARGGLGAINAHGLEKRGRSYVNEAFGKSAVTLRIDVKGGIGEINLEAD